MPDTTIHPHEHNIALITNFFSATMKDYSFSAVANNNGQGYVITYHKKEQG